MVNSVSVGNSQTPLAGDDTRPRNPPQDTMPSLSQSMQLQRIPLHWKLRLKRYDVVTAWASMAGSFRGMGYMQAAICMSMEQTPTVFGLPQCLLVHARDRSWDRRRLTKSVNWLAAANYLTPRPSLLDVAGPWIRASRDYHPPSM